MCDPTARYGTSPPFEAVLSIPEIYDNTGPAYISKGMSFFFFVTIYPLWHIFEKTMSGEKSEEKKPPTGQVYFGT